MKLPSNRICKVCNNVFQPKPYAYRQQVCENCIKQYKSDYSKKWREKNPDYYKNIPKEIRREERRKWREKNRMGYNSYMREYMRKYRLSKKIKFIKEH